MIVHARFHTTRFVTPLFVFEKPFERLAEIAKSEISKMKFCNAIEEHDVTNNNTT